MRPCPTCMWPDRETVNMVCPTCGTDYGEPFGPVAHVVPVGDLIEHDANEGCACGPTCEPAEQPDGSMCWVYTHHSLDGRERPRETGPKPENPYCMKCSKHLGRPFHETAEHPE